MTSTGRHAHAQGDLADGDTARARPAPARREQLRSLRDDRRCHRYTGGLAATGGAMVVRPVGGSSRRCRRMGRRHPAPSWRAPLRRAPPAGSSLERRPGGTAGNAHRHERQPGRLADERRARGAEPGLACRSLAARSDPDRRAHVHADPDPDGDAGSDLSTEPTPTAVPTPAPTLLPSPSPTALPTPTPSPPPTPSATPSQRRHRLRRHLRRRPRCRRRRRPRRRRCHRHRARRPRRRRLPAYREPENVAVSERVAAARTSSTSPSHAPARQDRGCASEAP